MEGADMYAEMKRLKAVYGGEAPDQLIREVYDKYADVYDQSVYERGYIAHEMAAKIFVEQLGPGKESMRILDAGCGTGIIGEHLRDFGFMNVDGLDPSEEMLNVAIKKGVYQKTHCAALIKNHRLPILDGEYDALICVGTVTQNHVKATAFDEMHRLVKPGGLICFTIRNDALVDPSCGYAGKFAELVNKKKWTLFHSELTSYNENDDDVYSKCNVLIYKVL